MGNGLRIRVLDEVDGVVIWRVDGSRVRDVVDVEFTNGHHHFSREYIPVNEVWIDRESPGAGEWRFWALRQLVERRCMAGGGTYPQALWVGRRAEREARKARAGKSAQIQAAARRRLLSLKAGREVWLVDGNAVRNLAFVDFTLGGHGFRYRFIPRGEIWIDDAVAPAERPAILCHEAVEVHLMARGMSYDAAHARASRAESRFRLAAATHA